MAVPAYKFIAHNERSTAQMLRRQEEFIQSFRETGSIQESCTAAVIARKTYDRWRQRFPEFRARVDAIKTTRDMSHNGPDWLTGFADFRLQYFGMPTTWFQMRAILAYEAMAPGDILLVLWPPEHGKTTLYEDYASMQLALRPQHRMMVGSEKQQGMSRKILGRIKSRMLPTGPFPLFVEKFGPFRPQRGEDVAQPWGADFFNVWKKGGHDERDYSMVALGFGSAVAGSRTDHLHLDDVQSKKSLSMTTNMFETFQQDWLTRPGEHGITTINGTRVGEDDIYNAIMEEYSGADFFNVIKFPALVNDQQTGETKPLWEYDPVTGHGYTLEQLDRLKRKVGREAWARNYMQNPASVARRTFTDDVFEKALNPLRSFDHEPPRNANCIVSIDPAITGRNATAAFALEPDKLILLELWEDEDFSSNEQIVARGVDATRRCLLNNGQVSDWVIETMAFQKGLLGERTLDEAKDRYGFAVQPHMTGINKYDEDIGIPSMASDYRTGRIELPYAGDDRTRYWVDELMRQHKAWRPKRRGNDLRQDLVVVVWFAWIIWRERRYGHNGPEANSGFTFSGMPFEAMRSGLLHPTGAR